MKMRCFITLLILCALTPNFAYSQVRFPVLTSDAVKEIFHQYNAPLLQVGIRSYGDVLAVTKSRVVFASDNIVEILNSEGMRITYVGIRPAVSIGENIAAATVVGKSEDGTPWYMRIRDEVSNAWIDPIRIFPQVFEEKRITMRLVDFEFMYAAEKEEKQERRIIQRTMPSGAFRAIVRVAIHDVYSKKFLLPAYIIVRIGSHRFAFTQETLLTQAKKGSDVVAIKDSQAHLLLPNITLSRGYYRASIAVHGPFSTYKAFSFSFFAR